MNFQPSLNLRNFEMGKLPPSEMGSGPLYGAQTLWKVAPSEIVVGLAILFLLEVEVRVNPIFWLSVSEVSCTPYEHRFF